jgi:hypothetical protein
MDVCGEKEEVASVFEIREAALYMYIWPFKSEIVRPKLTPGVADVRVGGMIEQGGTDVRVAEPRGQQQSLGLAEQAAAGGLVVGTPEGGGAGETDLFFGGGLLYGGCL